MTIDHINRIRNANHIENLRLATRKEQSNNKTIKPLRGIWKIREDKYKVVLKRKHLGYRSTLEEAIKLRDTGE